MTKSGLLGAAAIIVGSALAAPAMAQQVISNPGYCAQFYPNANCQNTGPGNPYTGDYQRRKADRHAAYRSRDWHGRWKNDSWNNDSWNDNRWDRHDSGFWPGDVAADVVDGAIGTAGAIATAPFRDNPYAYYNNGDSGYGYNGYGYNGWSDQGYAERNGFVCQPGTWFKGEDGRRHICQ